MGAKSCRMLRFTGGAFVPVIGPEHVPLSGPSVGDFEMGRIMGTLGRIMGTLGRIMGDTGNDHGDTGKEHGGHWE